MLQGNPDLTRSIIKATTRKQKVTVGCLSFEEPNIDEDQKRKIMEDFEKTLLPGLSKDEYNILWVEHTDKGRLELNFVIPKTEMTTGKSLQPYYYKQDQKRLSLWQNVTNIEHGLSNPKDPVKERTVEVPEKAIGLASDYKELDKTLHQLVEVGEIQSRDQMIELLQESGIQITRQNAGGISIKMPESKKARRFKGGIYNEQFRSVESLEGISATAERRAEEYSKRDAQRELERDRKSLDFLTREKSLRNKQRYQQKAKRDTKRDRGANQRRTADAVGISVDNRRSVDIDRSIGGLDGDIQAQVGADAGSGEENGEKFRKPLSKMVDKKLLHIGEKKVHEAKDGRRKSSHLLHGERKINDRIGINAAERDRERKRIFENIARPIITQSATVRKDTQRDKDRVRKDTQRHKDRVHEYVEINSVELQQKAKRAVRQRQRRRLVRERIRNAIESFRSRFVEFTDRVRRELFEYGGELKKNTGKSSDFRRYVEEVIEDQECDYGHGVRF